MEQHGSSDNSESDTRNEFDIVLLYEEETQTRIAERVCNNIRNIGRRYGVELRVQRFGQLQLGMQVLKAVDHVIINSSIIMFFCDTICLSDETNLFAAYAAINYKIQVPDQRQQWTTIPVAIEGNSKVVDKPGVMSLSPLKVSASGVLDRINENKLIHALREVLQVPFHNNWRAGQAVPAPSRLIAQNRTRQATDISKLASSLMNNQSALPPHVEADSQPDSLKERVETPRSVHGQEQQGSFRPQLARRHNQRMQEDPASPELRQIWNQQGARPKRSLKISITQSSAQTQLPATHRPSSANSTPGPDHGSPSGADNTVTSAVGISREEAGRRAFQADEKENRPHSEAWDSPNPFDEELQNAEEDLSNVSLGSNASSGDFSYSDAPSSVSDDAMVRRAAPLDRPSSDPPDPEPSQARIDPADGGPLEIGDAPTDGGNHLPNFDLMPEDERAELQDLLL